MRAALSLITLTAGALIANPVSAEVVAAADTGFHSRQLRQIPATPFDVWQVLVAPSRWWNGSHSFSGDAANLYIDSQATGCFCEKLPVPVDAPAGMRPGSVEHMRIVNAAPGMMLRMVGALGPLQGEAVVGTLTIALVPANGGTEMTWDYVVGGQSRVSLSEMAPLVDGVLGEQADRLAGQFAAAPPLAETATPVTSQP